MIPSELLYVYTDERRMTVRSEVIVAAATNTVTV